MRTTSIKWRGREVESPLGRKLVVLFLFLMLPILMLFGVFMLIVLLPICLLLHPFFRLLGRRGTIRNEQNTLSIKLDREAFRRR